MYSPEEPFESANLECSFNNLPDEMLELIISFLPPYKDLHVCMCVCKRWYTCSKNVLRKTENNLYKAITDANINWRTITPLDMGPSITKRFSHAACVHDNSMYIFGGCTTNSTAFNDLWRFDLSKRQWIRPLAMGTYPSPKAYATMIAYKECLILFGGWTYPLSSPICQEWTMFSEIHFYNPVLNRWILVITINNPPPMAGHSAIIKDDTMIVYGGLYKSSISPTYSSSEVWILDLKTKVWVNQQTSDPKPPPRYGQSLIKLNNNHLMILGGTKAAKVYDDCWILRMKGNIWTWFEITVKNKEWSVSNLWCNPACKVGDKIVILSHQKNGASHPIPAAVRIVATDRTNENSSTHRLEQNMRRLVDKDNNVNGRRGILPHQQQNNIGIISPKCEDSASPMVVDDEPKAGPSSECVSQNISNRLQDIGEGLNSNVLNNDQKENIVVCPPINGNKSNNNNQPVQNQHSYWRSKNGIGRKSLPNGIKIIRHIRDTDNFRMAAFSTDARTLPIPQDVIVHQRRIPNPDERQLEVRAAIINPPVVLPAVKKSRRNTLALHVLDISSVLNDNCYASVSWMRPQSGEAKGAPEEVMMYSLVQGKGELIMFGGLYYNDDSIHNCMASHHFSNSLHFITPPRDIV